MTLLVSPEKVCVETHDTFVSCEKVCIEEVDTFSIVPVDIYDTFRFVEKGMCRSSRYFCITQREVCIREFDTFSIVPVDIYDTLSITGKGMCQNPRYYLYHAKRYVSEHSILVVSSQ